MNYIVFEGIDKTRKSSFIQYFYDNLKNENIEVLKDLNILPKQIKKQSFPNKNSCDNKRIKSILSYESNQKYIIKDNFIKTQILTFLKVKEKTNNFYLFDRFFDSTVYTYTQHNSKAYDLLNYVFSTFNYKKPLLKVFFYIPEKEIKIKIKNLESKIKKTPYLEKTIKNNTTWKTYSNYYYELVQNYHCQINKWKFLLKVQRNYFKLYKKQKDVIKILYSTPKQEKLNIILKELKGVLNGK